MFDTGLSSHGSATLTPGDRRPEVAVLVATRNRPSELARCLASIAMQRRQPATVVLDNASDLPISNVSPTTKVFRVESALGVAAARNYLAKTVQADLLIYLDDDAEFATSDAVERLRHLASDSRVSLVALNCLVPTNDRDATTPWRDQMSMVRGIAPGVTQTTIQGERCIPCAVFIGAGFAVRRTTFEALGGFRGDFIYGGEEYHLCLRAIRAGLQPVYVPDIAVRHYQATSWRLPIHERETSNLRNRWATVAELIPTVYIPLALANPTARAFANAKLRALKAVRAAAAEFLHAWRTRRAPLSIAATRQVIRLRGRI